MTEEQCTCGYVAAPGSKFCPKCGKLASAILLAVKAVKYVDCPHCGAMVEKGAYCSKCGRSFIC